MRTTSFFLLLILCLALSASAQVIFSEGPIDGNDNAFFVTGPNLPNFLGFVQDVSNGFVAANSGRATDVEWAEWSVGAPTSFSYELGTSAFGNELGSAPLRKVLVTVFCSLPTASVMAFTMLRLSFLASFF
jgi:hypothetical protein